MKDCIFCKIANSEVPCEKVWEDENFLAFGDANPIGEGHTLIITKKHFDDLINLDEEISKKYFGAVKHVGKLLMEKYDCEGFNVVVNNGKSAGQVVGHVHFHILPRKEGDNKRGELYSRIIGRGD